MRPVDALYPPFGLPVTNLNRPAASFGLHRPAFTHARTLARLASASLIVALPNPTSPRARSQTRGRLYRVQKGNVAVFKEPQHARLAPACSLGDVLSRPSAAAGFRLPWSVCLAAVKMLRVRAAVQCLPDPARLQPRPSARGLRPPDTATNPAPARVGEDPRNIRPADATMLYNDELELSPLNGRH